VLFVAVGGDHPERGREDHQLAWHIKLRDGRIRRQLVEHALELPRSVAHSSRPNM